MASEEREKISKPITYKSIFTTSRSEDTEECDASYDEQIGIKSYLWYCEKCDDLDPYFIPCVYSSGYALKMHLPYINALLMVSQDKVYQKGLQLFNTLMEPIAEESLDFGFLDALDDSIVCHSLFKVITFSPQVDLRKLAFNVFKRLCSSMSYESSFTFLKSTLGSSDIDVGIRAICIDFYRAYLTKTCHGLLNHMTSAAKETKCDTPPRPPPIILINASNGGPSHPLEQPDENPSPPPVAHSSRPGPSEIPRPLKSLDEYRADLRSLGGARLIEFLDLCVSVCLTDASDTKILDNIDLLMATLNLFRFLKMETSVAVKLKIYHTNSAHIQKVKDSFFKTLHMAIATTKRDMIQHRLKLISDKNVPPVTVPVDEGANLQPTSISVINPDTNEKSEDVPTTMDRKSQLDFINHALCRLDMLECVYAQTNELFY